MRTYDAIVIGGGINGLVAGAILARRGKRVCLFEKRSDMGGMATLGEPFGPPLAHLLYNLSPVLRQDLEFNAPDWPFRSAPLPTVSLSEDGTHAILRGSTVELPNGAPHPQAKAYRQLCGRLSSYADLLRKLAETAPPGDLVDKDLVTKIKKIGPFARFGWRVKRMPAQDLRRFLHDLLSNAYDLVLDELEDGPLAGALAADAVRGAAAGPRSPGTVFSLVYRMGHGGDVMLPQGGMRMVFETFAGAALRAGCHIEKNTTVSRILSIDDQITGVVTVAGEEVSAQLVLSSLSAEAALRMTGVEAFDIEATTRIRSIRARGTAAKINLRLDRMPEVTGLSAGMLPARLIVAPSAEYVERAFNPSKYQQMSRTPVIEAVPIPSSRTGDPSVWLSTIVQYAPSDLHGGWTEAAKTALLEATLAQLDPFMPNLRASLQKAMVITPDEIAAATGAPGGHWHHAEMCLDQLLTLRPVNLAGHYRLGPKGLFLCGASTHPGGDVMGLAGRNAALAALEGAA